MANNMSGANWTLLFVTILTAFLVAADPTTSGAQSQQSTSPAAAAVATQNSQANAKDETSQAAHNQAAQAALEALEKAAAAASASAGNVMSPNEAAAAMFGGGPHDDLMAAESAVAGAHDAPPSPADHKAAYAALRGANEAMAMHHAQQQQQQQHHHHQQQQQQQPHSMQHMQHMPAHHHHQVPQQHHANHQPMPQQQAQQHLGQYGPPAHHGGHHQQQQQQQQQRMKPAIYAPPVGRQIGGQYPQAGPQAYASMGAEQLMPANSAPIAAHVPSHHGLVPSPQQQMGPQQAMPMAQQQQQQQPQQQMQPQAPQSQQLDEASSGQHAVLAPRPSSMSSPAGSLSSESLWPLASPEVPKIVALEVKCEKNLMKVSIEFDKIFNGIIFSKGHYSDQQCVHVNQNGAKQSAYFDIGIGTCGTQGNTQAQRELQQQQQQQQQQTGLQAPGGASSGTFFENTIVIQYDPYVQEVWDQARKLRCTWHDQYEKAVTFRPFPVDMLDIVRADFAGDNVGCWMQIQVGKGPWASEVAGIVKIGQTMTMVLAIKDEENKFDMLVRNCFAHDGKRGPIELVDKNGCITRPKLMSRFTKIKNFGSSATVLSYAHFQAFKFPDSMEVHFQCTIQICRHQCPEQCNAGGIDSSNTESTVLGGTFNINSRQSGDASAEQNGPLRKSGHLALARARRSLNATVSNIQNVGLNRVIQVVSSNDLAFALPRPQAQQLDEQQSASSSSSSLSDSAINLQREQVCMSSLNFVIALLVLMLTLLISSSIALSLYMRQRSFTKCSTPATKVPAVQVSPYSPTPVHLNHNHQQQQHTNHHHHQNHLSSSHHHHY